MRNVAKSIRPSLTRVLLCVALFEGIALLALVIWLGFLRLALAGLVKPFFAWMACFAGMAVVSVATWQFYKFARRRKFRFSLRTLLVTMCVLSVLLGFVGQYLVQLHEQQTVNRAVLHVRTRNGKITVGSPSDAQPGAWSDWTDLRNAVDVSFNGTTLNESDFAQLARIPSLAVIRIKNAPILEEGFLLLRRLPNLEWLVLENTGASDATLKRIGKMHPDWHVFRNNDEAKQWSMQRVRELKAKGKL